MTPPSAYTPVLPTADAPGHDPCLDVGVGVVLGGTHQGAAVPYLRALLEVRGFCPAFDQIRVVVVVLEKVVKVPEGRLQSDWDLHYPKHREDQGGDLHLHSSAQ